MYIDNPKTQEMKTAILHVRLTPEAKSRLSEFATHEGLTESDVIRRMLEGELTRLGSDNPVKASVLGRDDYRRRKITLTVPVFIADLALERALHKGMSLSRWIASLIQSHVYQPPVLTTQELKVLNESNRQIRAIGVNINQIAKSFNSLNVDIRKLKDFYIIEGPIRENIQIIDRLIRAANQSWGIGRGPD